MKTRLYTRKRALISSVAMLLVAMIALGTATFAWFTQSPLAYAEGFKMQASSSIGLKVLSESHANAVKAADKSVAQWVQNSKNYKTRTYIRSKADGSATDPTSFFLSPVTFYPTDSTGVVSAFTTTAADSDSFAKADDQAITTASPATYDDQQGVYYTEKVYATLVGAADANTAVEDILLGVSIDQTNIPADVLMKTGVIVVVTYHDSSANDGAGKDSVVAKVAATAGDHNAYKDELDAIDYEGKTTAEDKAPIKAAYDTAVANNTGTVNYAASKTPAVVGKVTAKPGQDYFTVYVGLDGMNSAVMSRNVDGSTLLNAVKLDMSIPTT